MLLQHIVSKAYMCYYTLFSIYYIECTYMCCDVTDKTFQLYVKNRRTTVSHGGICIVTLAESFLYVGKVGQEAGINGPLTS